MYGGEIAVNHCAQEGSHSLLLDVDSTLREPIANFPHVHCWPTDVKFSKHAFMGGRYSEETDRQDLDIDIVRDYCMEMSFRSLEDFPAEYGGKLGKPSSSASRSTPSTSPRKPKA